MVKSAPSVSSSPSQLYTRKDVVVSCVLFGHSVTRLNRGRVDWPLRIASPSLAPLAVFNSLTIWDGRFMVGFSLLIFSLFPW